MSGCVRISEVVGPPTAEGKCAESRRDGTHFWIWKSGTTFVLYCPTCAAERVVDPKGWRQ